MKKRVLVLGATGMFGKPAAERLKADGFQVRILARNVDKAKEIFDETFEIYPGDVTDLPALEKAMDGCAGVHISIGGPVDRASVENVAALAPKSGIERISYISGATVAEKNRWFPMVAQKLDAEKILRECGIPYTIFCPTWPMEQVERFAMGGKPTLIGKQPLPVHFFAVEDLARMISRSFQLDEAKNKRFYIYGPEAMPLKEAVERFCRHFYPEVKKVSSMPVWLAKLMGGLTGNEMLKFAANLMGYFDRTPEVGDPSEANSILGAPQVTFQVWMDSLKRKGN